MSDQQMSQSAATRKKRRVLAPSEKYELWVSILSGQATQREAAEKYRVDRSTVVGVCRTAKQGALEALAAAVPGRRGHSAQEVEIAALKAEVCLTQSGILSDQIPTRVRSRSWLVFLLCSTVVQASLAG